MPALPLGNLASPSGGPMASLPLPAAPPAARRGHEAAMLVVTALALILFVGIGGSAMTSVMRTLAGGGEAIDRSLLIALFLNIALILFGWRKHRDLSVEVAGRTAAEDRAHVLAARDPLTGLLNRRSLVEEGATLLLRAHRRGRTVALLMINLDQFRQVNEVHDHATGDALLRVAAEEIAAALPAGSLVARFGGDEFACAFAVDAVAAREIERSAEAIAARLAQPIAAGSHRVQVSASIGVALSDTSVSIEALVRAAEIAASAAKKAGRGRVLRFAPAMEQALQARTALEAGLRAAIPAGEIVPFFEKQIDLSTGQLCGFEVLARWEHPSRGIIGPDTFVPVAEEAGLIGELSLAVMRRAFAAARDWAGDLTLSVNISPVQLRDAWLPQKIIKTLTETGFPASRLEVEITESALVDNLALAQTIVGSLKNQGIRIALDDFGTGYSSLSHLRALPFDRIKIDKSFVQSMIDSPDSAAIVAAVAGLGESLHLPVTAEGIETAELEARLLGLGVGKGQGYHYGRPLSLADTRRLLAEARLLRPRGDELEARRAAG
jgi:diguanylate cyclase (GGDEF)-like protein